MKKKNFLRASCFLSLTLVVGCYRYGVKSPVELTHLVQFDDKGRAMDPTGNVCHRKIPRRTEAGSATEFDACNGHFNRFLPYRELEDEFTPYLTKLFAELAASPQAHQRKNRDGHLVRRVLLFIHGGLNGPKDTIDRAHDLAGEIMNDKFDEYYPIFINWQSSLPSSWLDHTLFVRSGQWYGAKGVLQAPFYLAADAARAVGRAPIVWSSELAVAGDSLTARFCPEKLRENETYCRLRNAYEQNPGAEGVLAISKGREAHTLVEGTIATTKWILMSPFKFGRLCPT